MKSIFESFGGLIIAIMFFAGYFPINMILAFIYGDKMDVVISLFIPFYGMFVMIFG